MELWLTHVIQRWTSVITPFLSFRQKGHLAQIGTVLDLVGLLYDQQWNCEFQLVLRAMGIAAMSPPYDKGWKVRSRYQSGKTMNCSYLLRIQSSSICFSIYVFLYQTRFYFCFVTFVSLWLYQVDDWLERLIEEKGEDLYRMKGILSVSGSDQRYVFQVLTLRLQFLKHLDIALLFAWISFFL